MPLKLSCPACTCIIEVTDQKVGAYLASKRKFKKGWPPGRRRSVPHQPKNKRCPCRRCTNARRWLHEMDLRVGEALQMMRPRKT